MLLYRFYDVLVLAHGAASARRMNVPGETDTPDCISARNFVGW